MGKEIEKSPSASKPLTRSTKAERFFLERTWDNSGIIVQLEVKHSHQNSISVNLLEKENWDSTRAHGHLSEKRKHQSKYARRRAAQTALEHQTTGRKCRNAKVHKKIKMIK